MKRKICIVNDHWYEDSGGGAENMSSDLALNLLKKNWDVCYFSAARTFTFSRKKRNGIMLYRIFCSFPERFRSIFSICNPVAFFAFLLFIIKEKPDIVHFHNVHQRLSYSLFIITKLMKIPTLITFHDVMSICYQKMICSAAQTQKINWKDCISCQKFRYFPSRNFWNTLFLNYLIDVRIAVSKALRSYLSRNGIHSINVCYNGIVERSFSRSDSLINKLQLKGKTVILYAARMSVPKGINVIYNITPIISKHIKDPVILIAGNASHKVQQKFNELPEQQRSIIEFTGWLDKHQMSEAFAAADIVLLPSTYPDPCPLTNMEAMMHSKPVVGTCYGGTQEIIIDEKNGLIADPNDTEQFAEKIVYLARNKEKCTRFGSAGRKRFLSFFTMQHCVARYEKIYTTLLQRDL